MAHINPDFKFDPYEALGLVQEECSEVIKEISKVRRSGVMFRRNNGDKTNIEYVQEEFWDLLVVAKLAGLDSKVPEDYFKHKVDKLKKWSNLF